MLIFYLIIGIVYAFLLRTLANSWENGNENDELSFSNEAVTILIPFRNEAENLPKIFKSIEQLNHPELCILWINDHSEDSSVSDLNKLIHSENLRFNHKLIQSEQKGKKSALETGVKYAESEFIITTDADCEHPSEWINSLISRFENPSIQMVAGPVMTKENENFFQRFQQIEWASILLVTQYAIANKNPLMCSGANLCYRKQAFQKVNGYQGNINILSGDDEFLLKKIVHEFGAEAINYATHKEALIFTNASKNWTELFSQRVRWASKYKSHSRYHFLSALLPAFLQLFWILSIVLPISYGFEGLIFFLLTWLLKIIIEYASLSKITKKYSLKLNSLNFCYTSLIHPYYVLRTAIGAVFGRYRWKGRS
ncbi:glycosyl transferase [Belliella baltica DSM 15883]|uniref:Glycosyl transferase n=1 Tax=Belliella baltica (strain DSM 15883 / CIP 108006 / LMG 21964 / BA134) TaxID=866536 RepID=I3Z5G5_BELBD|nr:glycosyltransferase [Belliella baltica]AFL84483.1 glycosyl transferase [Belliella baltica DSM 15883]